MNTNIMSKDNWIELFRAVGLNDKAMVKWHQEFETRYPLGHQSFLEWLGLSSHEIDNIRSSQ